MWFKKLKSQAFMIIFWLAIFTLIILFIWNYVSGKQGVYTDYTSMMLDLMEKPVNKKLPKKRVTFESKGETECRRVIEKFTGKPFPRTRPNFMLNNISGSNLELDCFNPELKIAVEYNGEQHYKYIPYFHSSKDAFYNIKYRDDIKKRLCSENGIKLIIVPYYVKFNDIETYIIKQLTI